MKKNIYAFTFVELVVSTIISFLVLGIIFIFISNIIRGVTESSLESKFMTSYNDFRIDYDNYKNIYPIKTFFGTGNNVIFLKNIDDDSGVLIGVVDEDTLKLTSDNLKYHKNTLGFREIFGQEYIDVSGDNLLAYDLIFYKDKIYPDIKVKTFEVTAYNSGTIFDISFGINIGFMDSLIGTNWSEVYDQNILKFNSNF